MNTLYLLAYLYYEGIVPHSRLIWATTSETLKSIFEQQTTRAAKFEHRPDATEKVDKIREVLESNFDKNCLASDSLIIKDENLCMDIISSIYGTRFRRGKPSKSGVKWTCTTCKANVFFEFTEVTGRCITILDLKKLGLYSCHSIECEPDHQCHLPDFVKSLVRLEIMNKRKFDSTTCWEKVLDKMRTIFGNDFEDYMLFDKRSIARYYHDIVGSLAHTMEDLLVKLIEAGYQHGKAVNSTYGKLFLFIADDQRSFSVADMGVASMREFFTRVEFDETIFEYRVLF